MPRERKNDYQRIASDIVGKTQNGNWKLYIIVAEGDKTEPRYFDALEKYYKESWDETNLIIQYIDRIDPSLSGIKSLKDTLDTFLKNLSVDRQIQEYDELWLILDTDDYENRKDSLKDLYRKYQGERNYYFGLSNPCFEI